MEFDFSGIIPAIPGLWNGMVMTLQLMVMAWSAVSRWVRSWR